MSEAVQEKPRTRRGVKILLFVSLAVNLLIAGLVLGAVAGHRFDRDDRPPRFDRAGGLLTAALTHKDRRAIGREMREAARDHWPTRAELRAEFEVLQAALVAKPYDPDAVRDAVVAQLETMSARAELGKEILLKHLSEMSDEERAAFAERLEHVLKRGPIRAPKGQRDHGHSMWWHKP